MARRYSKRATRKYRSRSTSARTRSYRSKGATRRSYSGGRRIELVIRQEPAQGVVTLPGNLPAVPAGAPRKAAF